MPDETVIKVKLDADDMTWLNEQAYPYGLDAAGYLRMYVRQARLGEGSEALRRGASRPPVSPIEFYARPPVDPPQFDPRQPSLDIADPNEPTGADVDLDSFIGGVVENAEVEPREPDEAQQHLAQGGVIQLGPPSARRQKWA
jgi:hypothetical protein